MKKTFSIAIVMLTFAGSSHSNISIGLQTPFSGRSFSHADLSQTESWIGVYGTIEYNFLTLYREVPSPEGRVLTIPVSATPIFGIELSGGRSLGLGGKDTRSDTIINEYKNSGNIICVLLKYYFPVSVESKFHLYVGCGPEISMLTREKKVDDSYEKEGELTNIRVAAPLGFDYDITEDKMMKLTTLISFQYTVSSTVARSGTTINYTLGVGLKRCF